MHDLNDLTPADLRRYSRHLTLPDVGRTGQRRLRNGSVLVIGAGGLGSPVAMYLAAAGVGRLGLVDFDVVDESNLQRQIIHGTNSVGTSKLESARDRIADLNPFVAVELHEARLSAENALEILEGFDVVVDGSDNFPTRYLANDACVLLRKPNVYGSIFRFEGQASVFATQDGPCYRCLFREPPPPGLVPSCAEAGVLGALPGIVGSIQALEAIKLLLGRGESLIGRLLLLDALTMTFRQVSLRKDPHCPVCGERPTVRGLIDYDAFCGTTAPVSIDDLEVSVEEVAGQRGDPHQVLLVDVREPVEWDVCRIEGAVLIPLGSLTGRVGELNDRANIVTYCHRGARSLQALEILKGAGFSNVRSLRGGIDAWAEMIDPSMPRY